MRRLLLTLCLRAYPRTGCGRDRDYLRDLALELSETFGIWPQALSLLRGGVSERIEKRRLKPGVSASKGVKRIVVVCFALAITAAAAGEVTGRAAGEGVRAEADRFECVQQMGAGGGRGCAGTTTLVAARLREGWECETRRRTEDGRRVVVWRCALGRPLSRSAL